MESINNNLYICVTLFNYFFFLFCSQRKMVDVIVSSAITMLNEFIVEEVNIRLGLKDNVR